MQASEEAVALAQEQVDLLTGRGSAEKAPEPREGQGGAGDPQAALLHLKALLEQHIVVNWGKHNLCGETLFLVARNRTAVRLSRVDPWMKAAGAALLRPVAPAGAAHTCEPRVVPALSSMLISA